MRVSKDAWILALGLLVFVAYLLSPVLFFQSDSSVGYSLAYSALMFHGVSATDLAQDIIGFRALVADENAYPNLGEAHAELGLDFPLDAVSTHPPTTFLFAAPVAFMPWRYASMVWAVLMLVGLLCTFRLWGFSWPRSIGLGFLSILWLPVMMSFGQLTILWLLFVMAAYKMRDRNPFVSGLFIGVASLVKLFPAIMITPFLLQKRWRAVGGFLAAMATGWATVFVISGQAIVQYAGLQQNVLSIITRSDNSSLFNVGYRRLGWPGLAAVALLFVAFVLLNRRHWWCIGEPSVSEPSWMFWTFMSVALLPGVGIYSLTPLLPIVLYLSRSGTTVVRLIGWASVVLPAFGVPWGDRSVPYVAGTMLLIGIGTTAAGRSPGGSLSQPKEVNHRCHDRTV